MIPSGSSKVFSLLNPYLQISGCLQGNLMSTLLCRGQPFSIGGY